ncbi:hypothetical protein, partial [Paraburkholderia sp. SIMBA_027]|uniref:hypothetical protein n=1 Tax=Paraburkholderia sp. SIMBA_027 TaxID=3085770 RepID=UPI00397CF84C
IITELTKIHQTSDSYIIKTPTNPCEIEIEETSLSRSYKYANSQLCYKLEISNDHLDTSINPKGNKNHKKLKLKLIIYDKKDNENNLE